MVADKKWEKLDAVKMEGLLGRHPKEPMPSQARARRSAFSRIFPAILALSIGLVYVLLRPPLFNYDGYVYRLEALEPFNGSMFNPHHLLWYPAQILVTKVAEALGVPTTVPFQLFGIVLNIATLFLFYRLLRGIQGSTAFSVAATLFVAFSPKIWLLGLQNQPYPLVFLLIVLYLRVWQAEAGVLPSTKSRISAALALSGATFFQQAAAILVPAGALALFVSGQGGFRRRLARAVAWGAGTAILIGSVYLFIAVLAGVLSPKDFLRWATSYLETQHSLQFRFPDSLAKGVVGISRSIFQTGSLEKLMVVYFTYHQIVDVYAVLGLAACLPFGLLVLKADFRMRLVTLLRKKVFVAICLFSMIAWMIFVILWEPAGYYWSLNLFPALLISDIGLRNRSRRLQVLVAVCLLALAVWNLYDNHERDRAESINFPEPLLASIETQLEARDIFIVLAAKDWFGPMDYDLLFTCLERLPRNPGRAILQDFAMKPRGGIPWREDLACEIESTLAVGGRVLVADHVFQSESYKDLTRAEDPFSEYIDEEYKEIDGRRLQTEVEELLRRYDLVESRFRIGAEAFLELRRR